MSTEDTGRESGHPHDDRAQEAGSVSAEAIRLLGALSGWAAQQSAEVNEGAEEVFRQARAGAQGFARGLEEHLATGSADCTWCPVCRTIHTVRALSPEARTHLTAAASSLVSAAAALLATSGEHFRENTSTSPTGADKSPRVQHIDLDDPGDEADQGPSA